MSSFLRPTIRLSSHITTRRYFSVTTRTMAASKQEWMVILPDYEGALAKRMEVRPYVHARTTLRGESTFDRHQEILADTQCCTGNISKPSDPT